MQNLRFLKFLRWTQTLRYLNICKVTDIIKKLCRISGFWGSCCDRRTPWFSSFGNNMQNLRYKVLKTILNRSIVGLLNITVISKLENTQ